MDRSSPLSGLRTGPIKSEGTVGLVFSRSFRSRAQDVEPIKGPKTKESKSSSSKGTKSQSKSSGKFVQAQEPEFEVADSNMPQNQEGNLGPAFKFLKGIRTNFSELKYDFEECYKALSEKFDWDNLEGGDYLFNCTKPFPLVMNGNRQIVPVDYFFNNDLKYLQEGISTMTYTTSTIKTRAAQYDLQGIKDMVPNIWNPVKVAYDKHARWSISHWRKQRKTFYEYARGLESSEDVYFTKRILAVTRVEEGDFPRLRINEIEDMLLLIVQNMLTNLSGDDVFDFAIALRMFIRSMVVQKRVRDLQMGVKRRNGLMCLDELYKFSDGTLTRLQTSLDDITKNIQMEYLPQRRWSSLEKKRD
ncbi:hypothetical protein Tco_1490281, partial [Tanacetum coccineum]